MLVTVAGHMGAAVVQPARQPADPGRGRHQLLGHGPRDLPLPGVRHLHQKEVRGRAREFF